MNFKILLPLAAALAPALLMLAAVLLSHVPRLAPARLWRGFICLSALALPASGFALFSGADTGAWQPWLLPTRAGLVLAVLVQLLGTVIGVFSSRYLEGEPEQRRYITALAGVLGAVQLLLLADHWLVMIAAWALAA